MTPQEQRLLEDFLAQLVDVKGVPKDAAADALIAQAVARQPDAAYLLVQRSLLLSEALSTAQARITELEAASRAPRPAASSFLDATAWGRKPSQSAPVAAAATSVTGAALGRPALAAVPTGPAASMQARGGGSFLGTAAAAAAGMVGGAFLFHGINQMMQGGANSQSAAAPASQPAALEPIEPTAGYAENESSFDSAAADYGGDDSFA